MSGGYSGSVVAILARYRVAPVLSSATGAARIHSTSPRELAEQALCRRMAEDAELAARCGAMTDDEWFAYLDAECGVLPGRYGRDGEGAEEA